MDKAIEHLQQALEIDREIDYRLGEAEQLKGLGSAYRDLGESVCARQYLEQALQIFEEIKSPHAEKVREGLSSHEDA